MTAMEVLFGDYDALRSGSFRQMQLPPLTPCRITVAGRRLERAAAEGLAAECEATRTGWSRRESWFGTGLAPEGSGPPLDGEWALSETGSLRLFHDGSGWRTVEIAEVAFGGEPILKEVVRLAGQSGTWLRYAVYWRLRGDDAGGSCRLASRFLGFAKET